MSRRNDNLPHTLLPISLALVTIRYEVYGDLTAPPPESIANFVAATVPVYEYLPNNEGTVRPIRRPELEGGMFRRNGTELYFLDGRPARSPLAVNADDVRCVIEMLKDPGGAKRIQSRWARLRSKKLRARSADLTHEAIELRRRAARIAKCDTDRAESSADPASQRTTRLSDADYINVRLSSHRRYRR